MDPYWQTRPTDVAKDMILTDWMSALENYDAEEISTACREYLAGPDCRVKPKPGDILKIMRAARAQIIAALPKPVEQPYSALDVPADERKAAAARIMGEVFAGKTMGGAA